LDAWAAQNLMGLYSRYILPHMINCACGGPAIMKARSLITPRCEGVVLELGFGTGHNLRYYDQRKVDRIIAVEPEPGMAKLARKAILNTPIAVDYMPVKGEDLALKPASVDTLLLTFTLCTIPDAVAALKAARPALKPSAKVLFCEHGVAPDASVARTQARLQPLWKKLAGGCHLNRDIPALLREGGFEVREMEAGYLPRAPRFAAYVYRGEAVAAG
jgi:SAM-dependent methyltransferase